MALDEVRNRAYAQALRRVITPESVVLDLGAGLGTLGLLAAKLGARRVYLVEPEDVASYAREIARANGLSDRVQVFQGRLEDVVLPGPVDVITSVMTGNFLVEEDLLPTLFRARDLYLKAGGVMLPSEGVMEVAPVSHPQLQAEVFGPLERDHLGLDVSCLREPLANTIRWGRRRLGEATPLAPPTDLFPLEFTTAATAACDAEVTLKATASGPLHGWLGWFRMRLGNEWLSTSPYEAPVHWRAAYLPVCEPRDVVPGERLTLRVQRPERGPWTWTTGVGQHEQRQSTFFGMPLTLETLARRARNASS